MAKRLLRTFSLFLRVRMVSENSSNAAIDRLDLFSYCRRYFVGLHPAFFGVLPDRETPMGATLAKYRCSHLLESSRRHKQTTKSKSSILLQVFFFSWLVIEVLNFASSTAWG